MNLLRLVLVFFAAAVLTLGVVACGDDDDDGGNGGQPTQEATRTPAAATSPGSAGNDNTPPPGGSSTSVEVTTENFAFNPSEITVPAGEPITFNFTNADTAPHTFTLYLDEGFTQAIPGGSASADTPEITVSFVDPGQYFFRCEIHNQMQGELTAE